MVRPFSCSRELTTAEIPKENKRLWLSDAKIPAFGPELETERWPGWEAGSASAPMGQPGGKPTRAGHQPKRQEHQPTAMPAARKQGQHCGRRGSQPGPERPPETGRASGRGSADWTVQRRRHGGSSRAAASAGSKSLPWFGARPVAAAPAARQTSAATPAAPQGHDTVAAAEQSAAAILCGSLTLPQRKTFDRYRRCSQTWAMGD